MSQTPVDSATPGGQTNEPAETRAPHAPGQQGKPSGAPRHRPARRSHSAAKAAATPTSAEQAGPAPVPAPAPKVAPKIAPKVAPKAASAATVTPAASAAATTPAAPEGRKAPARGATSKRPPVRKGGAQLIISRQQAEAEAAAAASAAAEPVAAAPAVATVAAAEPAVVPVLTPGAEAAPPVARKTRFGLPRRFQTPAAAPVAPVEVAPAPVEELPAAIEAAPAPSEAAPAAIQEPEAAPAPVEVARRYRFDSARRAAAMPPARPERQRPAAAALYTAPASEARAAATEVALGLPSIEELAERVREAKPRTELPPLTFIPEAAPTPSVEAERRAAPPLAEAAEAEEAPSEAGVEAEEEAAAARRRRRRRRGSSLRNGAHAEEAEAHEGVETAEPLAELAEEVEAPPAPYTPYQEAPEMYGQPGEDFYPEPEPQPQRPGARGRAGRFGYGARAERPAPTEPGWGAEQRAPAPAETTPYSGPEPAFARGFGPTPRGVATPVRETYPRTGRVERGVERGLEAGSISQLGAVIRESINAQTDRLLNELRRQQTPPALTLSLPSMPSSERVGVFVDVANLLYSARSLRVNIDFGQLLDFLRGNRRLARAQAYAPTNPEPGADQAFLSAVKGLGYRITTKNYKTFSSGAKKADLDLDLCMDIVRLVDAKALDTVVLVSGDSDFLPLLDYCADHGVRVEVAAFDDAASMILRQSCDLFINLSLVEAIRG